MAGARQKAPALLANNRGGRGRGLVVSTRGDTWRAPSLPHIISTPLVDPVQARFQPAALRQTRKVWRDWWAAQPSQAVDMLSDMAALDMWIICIFRRELYTQVVIAQPLVKGSNGQAMINPLERTIDKLSQRIERAEMHFGMTPLARFRLQLEYSDADHAAEKMAKRWQRREREEQAAVEADIIDLDAV